MRNLTAKIVVLILDPIRFNISLTLQRSALWFVCSRM